MYDLPETLEKKQYNGSSGGLSAQRFVICGLTLPVCLVLFMPSIIGFYPCLPLLLSRCIFNC